ncbi:hypothetical protein TSAR_009548, partial [Trichomalopsis sarcophagae]
SSQFQSDRAPLILTSARETFPLVFDNKKFIPEMRRSTSLLLAVIFAAIALSTAAAPKNCFKTSTDCVHSSECCSGCCIEAKCLENADACQSVLTKLGAGKGGPCANLDPPCKPSYTCVLQQALCVQAPCKPVPTCVPPDYHDYE